MSFDGSFFSTPNTTPSLVLMPIAVDPNFNQVLIELMGIVKTYLDGFNGVLDLIDSSLWRESVDTTIVVLFAREGISIKEGG